mgnify:CR=1 FL=1
MLSLKDCRLRAFSGEALEAVCEQMRDCGTLQNVSNHANAK